MALLDEIERLDPDALPPADDLIHQLCSEALTMPFEYVGGGDIEKVAIRDEREHVVSRIEALASTDLSTVDPLPYSRTLSVGEAQSWIGLIQERWLGATSDWWALFGAAVDGARDDVVLIREEAFFGEPAEVEVAGGVHMIRQGIGPASLAIRSALLAMSVDRVVVIREWGPSRELSVVDLEPLYGDGGEGLFTSAGVAWLLHASHEDVYALGGAIVGPFIEAWPEWRVAEWTQPSVG